MPDSQDLNENNTMETNLQIKNVNRLVLVVLLLMGALLVCTVDDFLSLHDIQKDYVSKEVLTYLQVETLPELPAWTNTELEWRSVKVSYLIRLLLILVSVGLLVRLRQTTRQGCEEIQTGCRSDRADLES